MAQYKITPSGVHDTVAGHFIPAASTNRHWLMYKTWKAEPNTPDPSWTEDEWMANEKVLIKQVFEDALKMGFVTSINSWKFDCEGLDILRFQGALDLAVAMSATTVNLRDFDNISRVATLAELQTIVTELALNYQTLINTKWTDQDAVSNAGYAAFVAAELVAHDAVVAAN